MSQSANQSYRFDVPSLDPLFDLSTDLLYVAGSDGCWRRVNPAFERILGFTPDELLARPMVDFVHPDDVAATLCELESLRSGCATVTFENRHRSKDGSYRWLRWNARAKDELIYAIGQDVTDRRQATEAPSYSEERFRQLSNMVPSLVWFAGRDGRVHFLNDRWYAFTGLTEAESLGFGWSRTLHPDDHEHCLAIWKDARAREVSYEVEARYRRYDGIYRWYISRAEPLRDTDGRVTAWFGTSTDIHDTKTAQEQLRQLNETLEQSVAAAVTERQRTEETLRQAQKMEAVGQLTGGVAHDFNNLLTVVAGNLDMIKRAAKDPERVRRLAKNALKAAAKGERLTQQLLAFSRRQSLRPETVDLNRLIEEFGGLLRRAVGESVAVETDFQSDLWPCAVDPSQFEAAILNLAVNARDAMPDGGRLTIETRNAELNAADVMGIPDLAPGPYLRLRVADTGAGIPPELLDRVFEPFFTTKEVGKGTGLGLSQVYGFVRQSGGHVRIASQQGAGTEIIVHLPRAYDAPTFHERAAAELRRMKGSEIILVVDDDADVIETTVTALKELGYRTLTAHNGPEAISLLQGSEPIHLLLSDVIMPQGMSGVQLAQEARRQRPGLPILLMSGYSGQALSGSEPFPLLTKPFRQTELARMVREALDAQQAASAPRRLSILLVEDDALVRLSSAGMIGEIGHEVRQAADARAALAILQGQDRVDVLFTDIGLPDMKGQDLAIEARRLRPSLGVIFATGYDHTAVLDDTRDARTIFVAKPYRQEDVAKALAAVVSAHGGPTA